MFFATSRMPRMFVGPIVLFASSLLCMMSFLSWGSDRPLSLLELRRAIGGNGMTRFLRYTHCTTVTQDPSYLAYNVCIPGHPCMWCYPNKDGMILQQGSQEPPYITPGIMYDCKYANKDTGWCAPYDEFGGSECVIDGINGKCKNDVTWYTLQPS
jgi:hypothetical protein